MRYGPQLSLAELQKQFARVAADGKLDIHFRHYLNQFALWADEREIINLATEQAQKRIQDERDQLYGYCCGLIGLLVLLRNRMDVPDKVKNMMRTSHRVVDAIAYLTQITPAPGMTPPYVTPPDQGAGGAASSSPSSSGG